MGIMNKLALGGVMAVALAATAYAGWFGWGKKAEASTAATASSSPAAGTVPGSVANPSQVAPAEVVDTDEAAAPVQLPADVSASLPTGHPLLLQPFDRVMGRADAPVTIIEYASLTCPHCAHFTTDILPQVEKEWIDTGKAKYVLRDLPWDNLALGMSKVTRCAPENMFYPLVAAFFANQEAIERGVDTLGEIKKTARLAGMDGDKVDACIKDAPLQALVLGMKDTALNKLGVTGTPTTFVNGIKVDGATDYKDLKKTLEQAYAAAQAAQGAAKPAAK